MRVRVDYTKSAQQNADSYYRQAKKLLLKKEGAERTIKELEKRMAELQEAHRKDEAAPQMRMIKKTEREWYEKFRWFFTSDNLLAIGGRDAQQNELINSRHFLDEDLFFHADIFGAAAVVLKGGIKASNEAREETAQFAACYSRAWEEGLGSVDVYAMRRNQVSKSTGKGSLGAGSFLLSGEREWHRNMKLSLVMLVKDEKLDTLPEMALSRVNPSAKRVTIRQGKQKKSDAAKRIAALLGYDDIDGIARQLPAGGFELH